MKTHGWRVKTAAPGTPTQYFAYDAESRITGVDSGVTYTYDADGNRVRKDVSGSDPTEYIYFNGEPIAEHDPTTGDWSDYIYANGKRIAKADNYIDWVHTTATSSGNDWALFTLPGALTGYVIQNGDKLYVNQYSYGATRAGVVVAFTDNSDTGALPDQDGAIMRADTVADAWHFRSFDLSSMAGKTVRSAYFYTDATTGAIHWGAWYQDWVVVSADGTVHPLYTKQRAVSLSLTGGDGMSGLSYQAEHSTGDGGYPLSTTTYYHEDHLGTSRLLTTSGGWPIWQGTFLPYGQEWNPQIGVNHYKFTGKERDAESGLDFFGARFYSSTMGRWMSPDWADDQQPIPYANLNDPQSLNLYSYVENNPMSRADVDGHIAPGCALAPQECAPPPAPPPSEPPLVINLEPIAVLALGYADYRLGVELAKTIQSIRNANNADQEYLESEAKLNKILEQKEKEVQAAGGGKKRGGGKGKKPHGNTAGNQYAELYALFDKNGNFLKWGVSQNSATRYSRSKLNGGSVQVFATGTRSEMLWLEQSLTEHSPGPLNKEPWAGSASNNDHE